MISRDENRPDQPLSPPESPRGDGPVIPPETFTISLGLLLELLQVGIFGILLIPVSMAGSDE
jgi:hypothetical protein